LPNDDCFIFIYNGINIGPNEDDHLLDDYFKMDESDTISLILGIKLIIPVEGIENGVDIIIENIDIYTIYDFMIQISKKIETLYYHSLFVDEKPCIIENKTYLKDILEDSVSEIEQFTNLKRISFKKVWILNIKTEDKKNFLLWISPMERFEMIITIAQKKKILQKGNIKFEMYLMNPTKNTEKILISDTLQEVISDVLRLSDLKNEIYIVKVK